ALAARSRNTSLPARSWPSWGCYAWCYDMACTPPLITWVSTQETRLYGEETARACALGGLETLWPGPPPTPPPHRKLQYRLGQPSPPALRLAHPQSGGLRRLRVGHHRHARLDD